MKNEKVRSNGANNEVLGKLQNLLKQLFEIDASSDLDFRDLPHFEFSADVKSTSSLKSDCHSV